MAAIPYVVGQWVRGERFYDRRELITEILEGPRESLWVLGTRRIGKTSLLKQLELLTEESPERGYFPVFWDLQGAGDEDGLFQELLDALLDAETRLERVGLSVGELEGADVFSSLRRLRRRLRARGLRLLLLCDEVEELIGLSRAAPALLARLRRTLQSHGDVRSVLASTVRLWELAERREDTSPFLHGFAPPLYLGPMSDDGARALIRQSRLPPAARPRLGEEEVEAIRGSCDNHPFLMQLLSKRYAELGSLDEAVEQVAADGMVRHFFAVDFELLSAEEQRILRAVAGGSAASSATLRDTLELDDDRLAGGLLRLENLGLLRRDGERRFAMRSLFFRRWLQALPVPASGARGGSAATPLRPSPPGLIADRYELLRQAGEGASGLIFLARDRLLDTRIALKILRPEYADHAELLARFRKEIVLSRDIGHPNILRVYHLGESEGRRYLTMQWVDGPTLADRIGRQAPLAGAEAAAIGAGLAAALEALHHHKVLHRDVKPQNVLLHEGREPLLTDFGLACRLGETSLTLPGAFLGTPNYVSPEQARRAPLDERSDLYSLGVVLFEMATGRLPFVARDAPEVLAMHRGAPPPDPREIEPAVSDELAAVILRCLEKEPDARYPDAGELRAALARLAAAAGTEERPESPGGPDALLPLVYDELRRVARRQLRHERPDHTLQPTALVHEAYLRLVEQKKVTWQGRTHVLAVGSRAMRRLLIDHARRRRRSKRGGGRVLVSFEEALTPGAAPTLDLEQLLAVDAALEKLRGIDARRADIVELRFFAGLTVEEVAAHLGVSKRTVEADWARARDWLHAELSG